MVIESKHKAINYLNIKLMDDFGSSSDCLHLSYMTIVIVCKRQSMIAIRYHISDYKAIEFLLNLLDINRRCFTKKSDISTKWKTISDQIINNEFENRTPDKNQFNKKV